jgi:hypothetical protein
VSATSLSVSVDDGDRISDVDDATAGAVIVVELSASLPRSDAGADFRPILSRRAEFLRVHVLGEERLDAVEQVRININFCLHAAAIGSEPPIVKLPYERLLLQPTTRFLGLGDLFRPEQRPAGISPMAGG